MQHQMTMLLQQNKRESAGSGQFATQCSHPGPILPGLYLLPPLEDTGGEGRTGEGWECVTSQLGMAWEGDTREPNEQLK